MMSFLVIAGPSAALSLLLWWITERNIDDE